MNDLNNAILISIIVPMNVLWFPYDFLERDSGISNGSQKAWCTPASGSVNANTSYPDDSSSSTSWFIFFGPKRGSNRAQNTATNSICFVLLGLLAYFKWFYGVLIIPKCLIHDSCSIAILCGSFLERPSMWPNLDPRTPYLSQKYFKKYKKHMETSLKLLFSYLRIWNYDNIGRSVYLAFPFVYVSFLFFWHLKIFKFGVW